MNCSHNPARSSRRTEFAILESSKLPSREVTQGGQGHVLGGEKIQVRLVSLKSLVYPNFYFSTNVLQSFVRHLLLSDLASSLHCGQAPKALVPG